MLHLTHCCCCSSITHNTSPDQTVVNPPLASVLKLLPGSCFELSPQGVVLISQAFILTFVEESCSAYFCLL